MTTQERILIATREAFDRHGLEGLSLRTIAAKVGITAMAIYRHYADKQALVDALVLDALAEWSTRVAALPHEEGLAKLEQIGEAFLDFALREPRRFEAAFLLHSRNVRSYPDDFVAGLSPAGNVQLAVIQAAMQRGELEASSPIEIMMTQSALSQGLISLHRAGRIKGGDQAFRKLYRGAMRRSLMSFSPGGTRHHPARDATAGMPGKRS